MAAFVFTEKFDESNQFYGLTIARARKELNEIKEDVRKRLEEFKLLIQKDLPNLNYLNEDWFLMKFLRASKFDLERAIKIINGYYVLRRDHSYLYKENMGVLMNNWNQNFFLYLLPKRNPEGRTVFLVKGGDWDPKIANIEDAFRLLFAGLEYAMLSEFTQINGVILVIDYSNLSLWKIKHLTINLIVASLKAGQGAYPIRINAIHVVNEMKVFQALYALIKPFLKEKIKKRMYFHGCNLNSLHDHVSPDLLPSFLGGKILEEDFKEILIKDASKFEKFYKDIQKSGFKINY